MNLTNPSNFDQLLICVPRTSHAVRIKTWHTSMLLQLGVVLAGLLSQRLSVAQVPFLPATNHPGLAVTDVSPDSAYGTSSTGENTGGRVLSVVVDPTNSLIVYAATELAGIWKSTDAAHTWTQTSRGLRSGITQTHFTVGDGAIAAGGAVIAVDAGNPRRLLYVTQDDDGRPPGFCGVGAETENCTRGGLWISTSAAGSWQHVNIPNCPQPRINSVAFAVGQPFVSTKCGLATTGDPNMASANWSLLTSVVAGGTIASLNGGGALFACLGSTVYRSQAPGLAGAPWTAVSIGGPCESLAVVPGDDGAASSVLVMRQVLFDGAFFGREVTLANFNSQTTQDLGFRPIAKSGGSGAAGVFAALRRTGSAGGGPGIRYDVFASDGFYFYKFNQPLQGTPVAWTQLNTMHADPWDMSFPPEYDPQNGNCTGYAANDGGVFGNDSTGRIVLPLVPPVPGCDPGQGWILASAGLHVMLSDLISGVSQPQGPVLYLPTGDNDVWVSSQGGLPGTWANLGANLGDAAGTFIDPALPIQVLSARGGGGGCEVHVSASNDGTPPTPANLASSTKCIASDDQDKPKPQSADPMPFAVGINPPSPAGIAQVMRIPSDPAFLVGQYYFAIAKGDKIVQSLQQNSAPYWVDAEDSQHFGPGQLAAVAVSGGIQHPTVYVLTAAGGPNSVSLSLQAGQIYRANWSNGLVTSWTWVSQGVDRAYDMFVSPYDPRYLYVTDAQNIKSSADGGRTWHIEPDLQDIATNHGEFNFGCGAPANPGGAGRTNIFANTCSLAGMAFNRDHPEIRVAALSPGGLAFSRDYGGHWLPLNATNNDPFFSELIEIPYSVWYDSHPNPSTGAPSIYVGLIGKSVKRIDGPFPTIASGKVAFCPFCPNGFTSGAALNDPIQLYVLVDTPGLRVPLHRGPDGLFRGSFLFDSAKYSILSYRFEADGVTSSAFSHTVTAPEISSGVAGLSNAGTPVITGKIVGQGKPSPGVVYVDLQLTDTGTGLARNISINQLLFRTLAGTGSVTYNTSLSQALPLLPLAATNLNVGASTTVRLYLNVPSAVTRFSITEAGTVQDGIATNYSFSVAQTVIP